MELNDLLALPYSKENIKKLDLFLAKTEKDSPEYLKAYTHKLIISPKINESLKDIYAYVPNFNKMEDEEVVLVCDTIMKLVLKAKRLDEYEKYLEIKATRISAKDSKELSFDRFLYYEAETNYNQAVIELKNYLAYDLDDADKEKGLTALNNLAFNLNNTELFLESAKSLEELYAKNLESEKLSELKLKELIIYFRQEDFEKVKDSATTYLKSDSLTKPEKLSAANLLLKVLLKENDYRKASILVSDYEDLLKDNLSKEALDFASSAKELYEDINNVVSVKYYDELIAKIKDHLNKPKKQKKEIYIIPEIIDDKPQKEEKVVIKAREKKELFNTYVISKNNEILTEILRVFNKEEDRLRDVLRDLGYLLEKYYEITKFNLVYIADKYYLHTYKNNKVYDRKYNELPESFIKEALSQKEPLFLDKELASTNIDIFTNAYFTSNFVASFPLKKGNEVIGVVEFCADSDFLAKDNNYEIFKLILEVLSLKVNVTREINLIKEKYTLTDYVKNNFYFGIKVKRKEDIFLNGNAALTLGFLEERKIKESDFLAHISSKDLIRYKDFIKSLYEAPKNNSVINFMYQKDGITKYLEEIYYVYQIEDDYILISILVDKTSIVLENNHTMSLAYTDNNTGLFNINKLYVDIEDNKNKRFSLAVFSSSDIKEYITLYGYGFYLEFKKMLANNMRVFFYNNYNITPYIIDDDVFSLLVLEFKDKRKEETLLKNFLSYLENSFLDLKYTVRPAFKMGVYTHIKEDKKAANELIDYAYNAYLVSDGVSYYNFKEYKAYFKEKEKYMLIRENILNSQIKVSYTQLVDVLAQEVYGYVVRLTMPNLNIYEDEIEDILERHHKLELFHKYKLTTLFTELREMYNEIKGYVEVMVTFNNKIIDDKFSESVLTQLNFFKLPPEVLSLVVDSYTTRLDLLKDKGVKIITKDIYDVLNKKVSNLYLDLSRLDKERLKDISLALNNLDATIYLGNVADKGSLSYIKEANISYIYGPVYSKTYDIKELIMRIKENN